MSGRHEQRGRSRLRWLIGGAAVGLATSVLLAVTPADASSATVNAQLSLSGVATKDNVLGGTTIGVHPSDTVVFRASALPTAGLQNVPGLGPVLDDLAGLLGGAAFQVDVTFSSSFPGGAKTFHLGGPTTGACAGLPSKAVNFPAKGTFGFTWKVEYVAPGLLGGCSRNSPNSTDLNLLKTAGVALNAGNQWVGKIVVATDPPKGGISIQLPQVSVAPSLPVVGQLPTVKIPGVSLPTLGAPSIPNLLPKSPHLPKPGTKSTASHGGTYTPPGLSIPDQVVPHGQGAAIYGSNGGGGFYNGALPGTGTQVGNLAPVAAATTAAAKPAVATQNSTGKNKTIDLASSTKSPSGQLPVILAILAIIALAMVAGTYARLYLIRRAGPPAA